jgi:hypothetical protein
MMSGRPALSSEVSASRVLVLEGETPHEVFDLLSITGSVIRARSALLFEVGEELTLRIEQGGSVWDATARVLAHVGLAADRVTVLEISERSDAAGPRSAPGARNE